MNVLHVDDEDDIRSITQMSLEMGGTFTVVSVDGGPAALEALKFMVPDVILLDVMMPGMSGPDLSDLLRADPATADLPIIFMTAAARPEMTEELMGLGAIGVIDKPFDPMELGAKIAEIIDANACLPQKLVG